jgi:PPM family protein phosphatase
LIHAAGVDVSHVGDSRAYLIRDGVIYRLTRDHSVVQHMIDAGMLSPADAATHPDANRITRALGMTPEVEVEVTPQSHPIAPADVFILTSDGLTDLLSDQEIQEMARTHLPYGLEVAGRRLIDLANARGGHDNITVQLLRVAAVGQPEEAKPVPHAQTPAPATAPFAPARPDAPDTIVDPGAAPTQVTDHGAGAFDRTMLAGVPAVQLPVDMPTVTSPTLPSGGPHPGAPAPTVPAPFQPHFAAHAQPLPAQIPVHYGSSPYAAPPPFQGGPAMPMQQFQPQHAAAPGFTALAGPDSKGQRGRTLMFIGIGVVVLILVGTLFWWLVTMMLAGLRSG